MQGGSTRTRGPRPASRRVHPAPRRSLLGRPRARGEAVRPRPPGCLAWSKVDGDERLGADGPRVGVEGEVLDREVARDGELEAVRVSHADADRTARGFRRAIGVSYLDGGSRDTPRRDGCQASLAGPRNKAKVESHRYSNAASRRARGVTPWEHGSWVTRRQDWLHRNGACRQEGEAAAERRGSPPSVGSTCAARASTERPSSVSREELRRGLAPP